MKKYMKNITIALICFLIVVILNFALPRLLPGNPIAYLSGFAEEEMTVSQYEYYYDALHLGDSTFEQFLHYIASLLDGSLGFSFKKNAVVSSLIRRRLDCTLQLTVPGVVLSTVLGLIWGLDCGYRKDSLMDRLSTSTLIVMNTVPTFLIALVLVILLCFKNRLFPYTGLSSPGMIPGQPGFLADRLHHLILPVLTLTLSALPSRFLLMRNTVRRASNEKYVLYARQRGLSDRTIKYKYILKNISQPFITMVGMSVSLCVGGSLIIENIFSIDGMGALLTEAVYTLDYPLMQGILFVTTFIMAVSIIVTDIICILIDPRVRLGAQL